MATCVGEHLAALHEPLDFCFSRTKASIFSNVVLGPRNSERVQHCTSVKIHRDSTWDSLVSTEALRQFLAPSKYLE